MDLTNAPPTTLGKYQIRGTLGRGAMGTVYDGWDPVIGRRVAIKTVRLLDHADPEAQEGLERFKREAQAAGRLTHPNIVGVYDYGETDETAYIVMEFVEGQSLKQLLDARERFPVAETVRIMEQMLTALQFSHESGIIHRDIKPGNVMMAKGGRVKLADFGIARIESSVMTQDGTMLGTPAYMSPEQLMALSVDARTDLYSAGVVLYQMLTGERPFEGGLTAIIHKALNTTPPRPSEIAVTAPPAFDAVVARAMAKRPADRYPDADSFARALRQALDAPQVVTSAPVAEAADDDDATVVARPAPAPVPAPMPVQTPIQAAPPPAPQAKAGGGPNMAMIGGVAAVVLLGIGGGAWFALRPSTPQPAEVLTATAVQPAQMPPPVSAPIAAPPAKPVVIASPPAAAPAAVQPVVKPAEAPSTPSQAATTPPPAQQSSKPVEAPPSPPQATTTAPVQSAAKPAETPLAPTQAAATPPPPVPQAAKPAETTPVPPQTAPTPPSPTQEVSKPTEPPAPQTTPAPVPAPAQIAKALEATPPPVASPPVAQPPAPAPTQLAGILPPNPAAIREALANVSFSATCAISRFTVSDDGGVTASGLVGMGEPSWALREAVEKAIGSNQLSWLMHPVEGPYCAAFDLVRPLAVASSPAFGLTMKDDVTRLRDEDLIRPILRLPDFMSYLQVDYLSHDGSVTHLFPAPGAKNKAIAANTTLPLGDPKKGVGAVGPPFGTDVIIAIASSVPLFPQGRSDDAETADNYLPVLRAAIDAARRTNAKLTGRALVLDTVAR